MLEVQLKEYLFALNLVLYDFHAYLMLHQICFYTFNPSACILYLPITIFSGGANVLTSSFALASLPAFLNSQSKVRV
jgi:hypothetical protein